MADYIVTSGELTTVANAIREKNGTSSNLSWPDGFVSGISSGGGGSSDFSTATVTLTNPPQGGGNVEFEQSVYISGLGSMVGGGWWFYKYRIFDTIRTI